MANERTRVLAARWIIPVSRRPINGGWIRMTQNRIVEMGQGEIPGAAEDLGDVAVLPGLVNAHTHLEFSDCRNPIGQPGVPLADWIGMVIAARTETTPESKRAAVAEGWRELIESGTSLAGEIATPPCEYPRETAAMELVTFAEVLGLDADRSSERLRAAQQHINTHSGGAISPHAPYSTSRETLDACVELSRTSQCPLAMHVAESPDERELLCSGGGAFADSLRSLGVWREGQFPWGDDAFSALIDRLAGAPRALLIHGNDLRDTEIKQIRRHDHLSVVYCPRTHHFFRYENHPVDRMLAAGVRVALGTDSRASNPDLNLWSEVRFLLQHRSDLSPHDVLAMATIGGADALGRKDLGRIEVGCRSNLGCVTTDAKNTDVLYEDLMRNEYVNRC